MSAQNLLRKQVSSEIRKRRLVFLTLVLLTFFYLAISFSFGSTGLLKYLELREKKNRLALEIQAIEARNARLRSELKLLKENPFYIEKYAREDFGMARPDEHVFKYEQ